MNDTDDQLQTLKTVEISNLIIGDTVVNLGTILEIIENEDSFSLIIERMQQRQVWKFNKTDELIIKSE